jgi:hypothetical protein
MRFSHRMHSAISQGGHVVVGGGAGVVVGFGVVVTGLQAQHAPPATMT